MPSTTHRRTERASLAPLWMAMCLAVLMASSTVMAQVAAALTPPVAPGNTDVPYPPNASGHAVVLIELVVEKDGAVSSAQVITGAEPFAEQARTAVLTWRFAPARRGDTPVAARIRARVEFHQDKAPDASTPESAPAPRADGVPRTPAPAAAAPSAAPHQADPIAVSGASQSPATPGPSATTIVPEAPIDVTVRGTRHEIGQTTLSAADVREMPGAFGGPFRAIGALPGVVPMRSELPYFYIRGAPPTCSLTDIGGSSTTTCQKNELGPVTLPSVGVEAFF